MCQLLGTAKGGEEHEGREGWYCLRNEYNGLLATSEFMKTKCQHDWRAGGVHGANGGDHERSR